MRTVSLRNFIQYTSRYLRPDDEYPLIITRRDEPEMVVRKYVSIIKETINPSAPTYSCGCELGKSKLCPKHGRS